MAKVKGPLFSISASGQIAKTLVYGDWKGIDVVRKYVIPANPNTAGQQQQRGYFGDAVEEWHTDGFSAIDVVAWNLYALAQKVAASGFNMCTKLKIAAKVLTENWVKLTTCLVTSITAGGCAVAISVASDQTGKLYMGTSKTSMFTVFDGAFTTDHYDFTVTGCSASTKYYFYIKNEAATEHARTGIYTFTTTA